jgi:hypothetical protein
VNDHGSQSDKDVHGSMMRRPHAGGKRGAILEAIPPVNSRFVSIMSPGRPKFPSCSRSGTPHPSALPIRSFTPSSPPSMPFE